MPGEVARTLSDRLGNPARSSARARGVARAIDLPWTRSDTGPPALATIRTALESEHYAPAAAVSTILGHIVAHHARATVREPSKAPLRPLCLCGPDGVRKTAIARSIANALGRPCRIIDLAQLNSAEELWRRNHEPGALMSVIEKVKSADAVVVLAGFDRAVARLRDEAGRMFARLSDADHCANFSDPFFGIPFDLSRLLVIVTSRWPQAFSGVDRGLLAVAEFPGLLTSQKVQTANRTMIPEALVDHGLTADVLSFDENALHVLIESYTEEAGVTHVDELIRKVVRKLVVASTLGEKTMPSVIQSEHLFELAGRPPAFPKIDRKSQHRGRTNVLVVDEHGGHRGQASAVLMPGPGVVTIYDSTGTDISERLSMVPAVVRSRLSDLGVSARFMQEFEMQVAVPSNPLAGDETSTGLAAAISIVSLARDRPVDPELAATGTLAVDGRIEPTLGVSHKVLAAHRTGVRRVLLPRGNERDLDELPPQVHDDITFVPVDDIAQALQVALR